MNVLTRFFTHSNSLMRTLSTINSLGISSFKIEDKSTVIQQAKRVVAYPKSFRNYQWILNEESVSVLFDTAKLIGIDHPCLKTTRSLLLHNEKTPWGLIVLLVSKVAGFNCNYSNFEYDRTAGVLYKQQTVAEITEMIKTSHLIHKNVTNTEDSNRDLSVLKLGNGLALLYGDYLLSMILSGFARLKNLHAQETMASAHKDLTESEFIGLRNSQNQPIPSKPLPVQESLDIPMNFGIEPFKIKNVLGNMEAEWTLRNVLGGGSLLAKGCQSTLILANHDNHVQELGHIFGRNLALAWQASLEKDLIQEETFSLVSAPVMFHLESDPSFYQEIEKDLSGTDKVDYDLIRREVLRGPGIQKTSELKNEFGEAALKVLDNFEDSDSKIALVNIVTSL